MSDINANPATFPDDDEIDLLALAGTLWDSRWLIIAVTAVFACIGVAYALFATPIYEATSLIQVEEKQAGLPGMDEISSLMGTASKSTTEIEIIKSRTVLGKVVDELNLDIFVQPNYFPLVGKAMANRAPAGELAEPVFGEGYAWGGEKLSVTRFDVPEWEVGLPFELKTTTGGWALFNEAGEQVLQGRANTPASSESYRVMITELRARPGTTFTLIKKRRYNTIADLQAAISASEKGKDSGIIALTYEHPYPKTAVAILDALGKHYVRQNVERNSAEAAQSLEFLQSKLPDIKTDLEAAEGELNRYQVTAETIDITAEAQALLEQVVELEKRISELDIQRAEIEQRFRPTHPRYLAWASQMAELKERRAELDRRIGDLPQTQQELVRLRRDVEVGNEIYLQMLANVQQLNIARAGTVGNVRVVDSAAVDVTSPVKPKRKLIAAIATLLGGFIAVAAVLLRAALNRGVENSEEIEKLGLPVYASIPLSNSEGALDKKIARGKYEDGSRVLAVANPADLAIEGLRSLRTSLHFGMMDATNNILMITGPSPDVGKTFTSVNLAAVMAQADKKVLLIDADMRKGTSHKLFRIANQEGLSDLLAGTASIDEVTHRTEAENLHFISRGTVPPNPSELLMGSRFTELLTQATANYDLVIIDTPPVLAVTDAAVIGRHAGTTMLVSRFGLNPAKEIELTKQRFEHNGVTVKGVIFNAVVKKSSAYNYGYYNYAYAADQA
ncbi:polysaccharide biosynthesis tyrosine autokinase [Gilvimarinus sp. F26214L]|uniref:polysaccharide biosynthesis tyrosine autokinase n=1 Tax=Gilvimarinus sp. DZF01 TaxID=3461371 RepID=UPI0040461916